MTTSSTLDVPAASSSSTSLPSYAAPAHLLFRPLISTLSSPRNITTAVPIRNQILSDLVSDPEPPWDLHRLPTLKPVKDPWAACTSKRGLRCIAIGDVPPSILSNSARRTQRPAASERSSGKWALLIVFSDQSSSSTFERAIGSYLWISEEPDLYDEQEINGPSEYAAKPRSCHVELGRRRPSGEALRLLSEAIFLHLPELCAQLFESKVEGSTSARRSLPDKVEIKMGSVEQSWMECIEGLCVGQNPQQQQQQRDGDSTSSIKKTRSRREQLFRTKWSNRCFTLRMGERAVEGMMEGMNERRFGGLVLRIKEHGSGATELILHPDEGKRCRLISSALIWSWVIKLALLAALYAVQLELKIKTSMALLVLLFPTSSVGEERVLVSPTLGIQRTLITTSHLLPGRLSHSSTLYTRDRILDVLMLESFRRFKVVDDVVIACTDRMINAGRDGDYVDSKRNHHEDGKTKAEGTRGQTGQTIVLFPSLRPRLPLVKQAYRTIYTSLYSSPSSTSSSPPPRWGVGPIQPSKFGVVQSSNKIPFSLSYVTARGPMGVMVRDLLGDGDGDGDGDSGDASSSDSSTEEKIEGRGNRSKPDPPTDVYPTKRFKGAPAAWCYPHAEMSMAALHVAEPYRRLNQKLGLDRYAETSMTPKSTSQPPPPPALSFPSPSTSATSQRTAGRCLLTSISPLLYTLQRSALLLSSPSSLPRLSILQDKAHLAPVYADTEYGNEVAASFFQKMGFRRVRENGWLGLEIGLREVLDRTDG